MAGVICGRDFESAYQLIHEATTFFDARDELESDMPHFITLQEFKLWLGKFCADTFKDEYYNEEKVNFQVKRIYGYFNYVPRRDYVSHDNNPSDATKVYEVDVFRGLLNYIIVKNGYDVNYKKPYRGYGKQCALVELCKAFTHLGILTEKWKDPVWL